jgi:uncharacterized membrane protein required for colicin V production
LDIIGAIRDAPYVDLAIVLGLAIMLVLGVMQGPVRRLFAMLAMLMVFLIAANLRDPFGDFLNSNWRQFDEGYNRLLAFAILFAGGTIVASAVIQFSYKRTDIDPEHPVVEDALGGLLGLAEGLFILMLIVIVLDSVALPPERPGDLAQVRQAQDLLIHQSHIAGWIRDVVAPLFVHLFSALLPSDLVSVFP